MTRETDKNQNHNQNPAPESEAEPEARMDPTDGEETAHDAADAMGIAGHTPHYSSTETADSADGSCPDWATNPETVTGLECLPTSVGGDAAETVDELLTWKNDGRACVAVKRTMGHYCGYARTSIDPNTDVLEDRDDWPIRVHGRLSYGVDENGYVGIDFGHAWDVSMVDRETLMEELEKVKTGDSERPQVYESKVGVSQVVEEVDHMANELTRLEQELNPY